MPISGAALRSISSPIGAEQLGGTGGELERGADIEQETRSDQHEERGDGDREVEQAIDVLLGTPSVAADAVKHARRESKRRFDDRARRQRVLDPSGGGKRGGAPRTGLEMGAGVVTDRLIARGDRFHGVRTSWQFT